MTYQGKRVLVAGGAGLVGSHLIQRLLPLGAEIRATLHHRGPTILDRRVEYVKCDLTRFQDCQQAVRDMDYVFMGAAVIAGAGVITRSPLFNVTPNILLNTLMLQAAYEAGVKKYLTFGSSTAYPVCDQPLLEEQMMDGDPYEKYFFIGWVMRFKEKLCEMYSNKIEKPMPVIVLRLTNIYGPYDNFEPVRSHVTPALVRKAVEGHDPLEVWGNGEEVRDLVYVDDVIDAVLLALERVNSYDPINIAAGQGHSVKEILGAILEVVGYSPRIFYNGTQPTTIAKMLLDNSKAKALLGWTPKTGLQEGLARTVEWYVRTGQALWAK